MLQMPRVIKLESLGIDRCQKIIRIGTRNQEIVAIIGFSNDIRSLPLRGEF